jgi:hypothetical protein
MSRHVLNPMQTEGYQFKLFVDPEEHMAEMKSSSDAYGGTPEHLHRTMRSKLHEAQLPKGMAHGGGLFEAIHHGGEQIRKPAHVIIDPVNRGEEDPYGREGPMQWEGHHRIAVAAESQRLSRAEGVQNYHKYVPIQYHETAGDAIKARYSSSWPKSTQDPHQTTSGQDWISTDYEDDYEPDDDWESYG